MVLLKNFPPPMEGIHHAEPNTTAYFEDNSLGKGTLYIAESVLCWLSSSGEGFSLNYPSIYIHAISKDLNNFPHECLYLMIDGKITMGEESEAQELTTALNNLAVDEDEEEQPSQMRFVPDNKNMLDVMFRALLDCQALNPDQSTMSDEDDDDDGVVLPPITFAQGNGVVEGIDDDIAADDDSDMNEEQFEDAEQ